MNSLSIRQVSKYYGVTKALDGLSLTLHAGEILGIAGPNGAGKSTLMRVLAGEESTDAGGVYVDEQLYTRHQLLERVAVVHQEPQLFPNLTVGENLMVGREGTRLGQPKISEQELTMLRDLNIEKYANQRLEECPLLVRQLTEITKALVRKASVILLDEPNSALTEEESEGLFRQIHTLKDAGYIIVLVTHRLRELVKHSDRIAVIKDGKCTDILEGEHIDLETIASKLIVESRENTKAERVFSNVSGAEPVLSLADWTHHRRLFRHIDLQLHDGEIIGVVGVEGSGARELLRSIVGLEPAHGTFRTQQERFRKGKYGEYFAYLPADRKMSAFHHFTVGENLIARLSKQKVALSWGYLRKRAIEKTSAELIERFRIKTSSTKQLIRELSGGNQQKVVLASSIVKQPKVLILEEPTRGVDIQSKGEIYEFLKGYAREGHGVIAFCTEILEAYELADKVVVCNGGQISEPLDVYAYASEEELTTEIARLEKRSKDASNTQVEGLRCLER